MKKSEARKLVKEMEAIRARLDRAFALLGEEDDDNDVEAEVRISLHNINSATAYACQDIQSAFNL